MDISLFKEARRRIAPYIVETPLVQSLQFPGLSLKCENLQWTGSYKPRGALNAAIQKIHPAQGIVARSSGNFAQGIAYAGRQLGFQVTVVMPEHTPELKVRGARALGAEVVVHGTTHAEGYAMVEALVHQGKGMIIHAFDDPDVIAGQGSIALEVVEQTENISSFFAPIGGGGVMAGCACVLKQLSPRTQVIAVEPTGAAKLSASFKHGKRDVLPAAATMAEGLLSPCVGVHNWPLLKENVDAVVTVSEEEILAAMHLLFENFGFVVEPSGAVSVAGYLKMRPLDGSAVCVLTGSNIDRKIFVEKLGLCR